MDLVASVVSRLDIFSAARVATVCTSWAKAVTASTSLPFGMPCLLTSHDDEYDDDDDDPCKFYLRKLCTTRHINDTPVTAFMGALRNRWWVGANGSWIATIDSCCNAQLINPYTGEQIELPPGSTLPDDVQQIYGECSDAIAKIVLCETPSPGASNDGSAYLAVALVGKPNRFVAIARGGDKSWTVLMNKAELRDDIYKDAIVHKGKVFAIARHGDVLVWDIPTGDSGTLSEPELMHGPEINRDQYTIGRYYLAETADGHRLLHACTYGDECTYKRRRDRFKTVEFYAEGMLLYELDIDAAIGSDGYDGWRQFCCLRGKLYSMHAFKRE